MKTYTKAQLPEKTIFWHFGVALGFISETVKTAEDIAKELDRQYTKEEILDLLYKPIID